MSNGDGTPRPTTPVSSQAIDPALIQQMLVALTNLQLQVANRPTAQLPSRDPKVPDVQTFSGNKGQYSLFLARLVNFFTLQPNSYDCDSKKIGYVISRLEGSAADWAVTILENPDYKDNWQILNDWNSFLKAFSKFSDPFARQNSTDSLLSLSQGKSQSVLSYWTKFSELLYRSDISPDSARPLFERGLKYEIRDRLVDKDLPTDLDGFVLAVIDLDNRLFRLKQDRKNYSGSSQSYTPRFNQENTPSGVAPMDIGALESNKKYMDSKERWDQIRQMEPDERRKVCFDENRCHYCKRIVGNPPSHVAQNCPLKQNKSKSDYFQVRTEVHPQTGIPDNSHSEGIPKRQVFSLSHPDMNFKKDILLYYDSHIIPAKALIDSGAMGFAYMDAKFAEIHQFAKERLVEPIEIKTVDGSPCGNGKITQKVFAVLEIAGWKQEMEFMIISSPSIPVILGWNWLKCVNPIINWKEGSMYFDRGTLDFQEEVPQRQVFVDLISVTDSKSDESPHLKSLLEKYEGIFATKEFPDLAPHRPGIDLNLELIDGKAPPFGPIYSLSKEEETVLRDYIDKALESGIISKSTSPAGSPVMFVKKPDGSLRLCVDYRALNSVLITDRTALPIIKDMLQRVKGSNYFSKIDLKSAFYLIRIAAGQEYLTAFRTKYGHYEYKVMPFGLKNAPGTFQGFMNYIFADLIDRGVLVYIDDLLIYSKGVKEHMELLSAVFERIQKYELLVNGKKCVFLASRVNFLGHVLSRDGIEMDQSKLEAIESWEFPSTVKQMRSFLGLANYYRDFIPNFSRIAGPLFDLTKEKAGYKITAEAQRSFIELKGVFRQEGVLMFPDQSQQFFLEVDASDYAIGGALHQIDPKTQSMRPIGFFSRKLSSPEQNYEIYDKELLAVIEGFKNWRYLLIGTQLPVVVFTDHRNLEYFMSARLLNRRQARWAQFLADFNFLLQYRPGKSQMVADALSRQESYYLNSEDRLLNHQTLLPKELFTEAQNFRSENEVDLALKETGIPACSPKGIPRRQVSFDLQSTVIPDSPQEGSVAVLRSLEFSDNDADTSSNSDYDVSGYHSPSEETDFDDDDVSAVGDITQFMEFQGSTGSEDPPWFQHLLGFLWDGDLPMVLPFSVLNKLKMLAKSYIFKNDRLYRKITRNQRLYHVPYVPYVDREAIIAKYHTILGHMQVNTLLPLMEIRYYWPSLKKDIQLFQNSCPQCQMNGSNSQRLNRRPLQPHEPVGIPFLKWGIDYVQDLPISGDGYCNIFSARCYATKRVIYVATKDRTAKTAAECIFREIVCKYGSPLEIVSDRGFMDSVLGEYLKILEIHHLPSAAYTPKTNGLDERGHQDLKNIITKLSDGDPTKWTKLLPLAEFILNSRISNSTGFSAFYLSHGFEPRLPGDELPALPPGYYDPQDQGDIALMSCKELARLGQNRAAALQRLKAQAVRMKSYYDKKMGVTMSKFNIGDVVKMVNHSKTRLKFRFTGPFYIVDQGPNNTYRPDGRRWTSQNGTDIPVNPDYLAYFTELDPEYYYDGN